MKRTYHFCWSGGEELLFRTKEDYIHGIVCLTLAAHKTDATILAYCLMSNHIHICVRTENTKAEYAMDEARSILTKDIFTISSLHWVIQ